MPDAVVFDEVVLARLQLSIDVNVTWLQDFGPAPDTLDCQRVVRNNTVYFLAPEESRPLKLLVIDTRRSSGFFHLLDASYRVEAFFRLIRAARIAMEPGRQSIPHGWGPFHAGSRQSFFARHGIVRNPPRIEVDVNPRKSNHIFAFALSTVRKHLEEYDVDYTPFDVAMKYYQEAQLKAIEQMEAAASTATGIGKRSFSLTTIDSDDKIAHGRTLDDWLSLLTIEQRAFIECPLDRSLRLVGAAGTGKSLSMMLKCLSEFEKRGAQSGGLRILFLTFSQSTADTAIAAFASLDRNGTLGRWPESSLKVSTLQSLAYEALRLEDLGLEPLTSDGIEAREWQRLLIADHIGIFRKKIWPTVRNRCSPRLQRWIELETSSPESRRFIDALMNEFACVLEAGGVRSNPEARERYLKQARKPWMMVLDSEEDRRAVLELYDMFREELRASKHIGPDQLIADYLVELGTNRWDRIRERNGFDIVFVDELHLFNRQERMIPHLLVRDPKTTPVVVMAYDMKQSVRDSFNDFTRNVDGTPLGKSMGLGLTNRFELNKSFRYTPEIATLLEWIDLSLPAVGIAEELGDEWASLRVASSKSAGSKPIASLARDTQQIYSVVFPRASRRSKHLKKTGGRVAVLCLSETLFSRYADAGVYRDLFVSISERGDASSIRRAGQRFIFSMPEFVAGLQFDTVYLIEANENEASSDPREIGEFRQFVSQIYLGASRAESTVEVYASKERGGISRCFKYAVENGALDVVAIDDLPEVV